MESVSWLMCRSKEFFSLKKGQIWTILAPPNGPLWDKSHRMHHITFEHFVFLRKITTLTHERQRTKINCPSSDLADIQM